MTEQEAQTLVARLIRIWPVAPEKVSWQRTHWENSFIFLGALKDGSSIEIQKKSAEKFLTVKVTIHGPSFLSVLLLPDGTLFPNPLSDEEQWEEFQYEQMPLFRRNCWLSGANIEASAHEKSEWLQGFTREESEAWKLNV